MKIDEMTADEIVKLTDEEIDLIVKARCLEEGVPLEPLPPASNMFEIPKTIAGYKVAGTELWFEDRKLAESMASLLNTARDKVFQKKYEWQTGYDIEWLEPYQGEIGIEEKMFYDKTQVLEKEALLLKRKNLKEQYDNDLKLYEKSRDKRRKIGDEIYSFYYESRKTVDRIDRARTTFAEYVKLSDGDEAKAKLFFDKAYKNELDPKVYSALFSDTQEKQP